jgi:ABC-type transport system involved in cytochrome c biogenesis permease subunit
VALVGWGLLGLGLVVRMVILGRPPVATLYESVLFVAWGSLGLAMLFRRSSGAILPAGILVALGLSVVSHGLTQGQDTMGMLTAVLDTNFWLATHVLTITGGYAASLLVGGLALWALLQRATLAKREARRKALRVMAHLTLWAMLLTATGTLLGGIWASQSWGRFWGWDPKENGALILTLWLVMVMHLRFLKPCPTRWMLVAAASTPVVVALSWFGVNLLGVGLHSYGFATGLAGGLALFCAGYGSVVIGLMVFDRVKPYED